MFCIKIEENNSVAYQKVDPLLIRIELSSNLTIYS